MITPCSSYPSFRYCCVNESLATLEKQHQEVGFYVGTKIILSLWEAWENSVLVKSEVVTGIPTSSLIVDFISVLQCSRGQNLLQYQYLNVVVYNH